MSDLIFSEDKLLCSFCWIQQSANCLWRSSVICRLKFWQWCLHGTVVRICRFYNCVACELHCQVHLVCNLGKAKCPEEKYGSGGLSMSIPEAERVMWDHIVLFSYSMVVFGVCLNACPKSTHKYLWEVLLLANSVAILLANENPLLLLSMRSRDTQLK